MTLHLAPPLNFGAQFKKLPSTIVATKQEHPYTLPSPWVIGDIIEGEAGDYIVRNLTTGETYPVGNDGFHQKYKHTEGHQYVTKGVVMINGRLPKEGEDVINTKEGPVHTHNDGVPAVIMQDKNCEYPLNAKSLLKLYEPIDKEAKEIFSKLKQLLDMD